MTVKATTIEKARQQVLDKASDKGKKTVPSEFSKFVNGPKGEAFLKPKVEKQAERQHLMRQLGGYTRWGNWARAAAVSYQLGGDFRLRSRYYRELLFASKNEGVQIKEAGGKRQIGAEKMT